MIESGIQFAGGDSYKAQHATLTNATGGKRLKGDVSSIDFLSTNAAATTPQKGRGLAVAPSAPLAGMPVAVADTSVDDAAVGGFVVGGPATVKVNAAVAVGDPLKLVAGQTYAAKAVPGDAAFGFALGASAGAGLVPAFIYPFPRTA